MRRILALLILVAALAPGTWLREALRPPSYTLDLRFVPVPLPPETELARHLGPFHLEAAWELESSHEDFGSYSALVPLGDGRLLAFSDRGFMLRFSPPGSPASQPFTGPIRRGTSMLKKNRDAEAATIDPTTGTIWIGWEYRNAISRLDRTLSGFRTIEPPAMHDWGDNSGPEAIVRLADGRFLVLREGFDGLLEDRRHQALLFAGDPVAGILPEVFDFAGSRGFSPTDMAPLPDGRVLILMRKLVWPFPPRFAGRIVLADPAAIRAGRTWRCIEMAKLASVLPVDNFEGMAVEPRKDGRLTVWLISDDNSAALQRALLWKLALDPADLPPKSEKARGNPARPSAKTD
ncbi:MAG: esterase-like activity of phytase family protein [Novosphingobium sp.]|nr:esterase-like activity of phytase family protein [Novosphingobium sp.]